MNVIVSSLSGAVEQFLDWFERNFNSYEYYRVEHDRRYMMERHDIDSNDLAQYREALENGKDYNLKLTRLFIEPEQDFSLNDEDMDKVVKLLRKHPYIKFEPSENNTITATLSTGELTLTRQRKQEIVDRLNETGEFIAFETETPTITLINLNKVVVAGKVSEFRSDQLVEFPISASHCAGIFKATQSLRDQKFLEGFMALAKSHADFTEAYRKAEAEDARTREGFLGPMRTVLGCYIAWSLGMLIGNTISRK